MVGNASVGPRCSKCGKPCVGEGAVGTRTYWIGQSPFCVECAFDRKPGDKDSTLIGIEPSLVSETIEALENAIENTNELLINLDAMLGRTTTKNRHIAEMHESQLKTFYRLIDELERLLKPKPSSSEIVEYDCGCTGNAGSRCPVHDGP